MQQQPKPQVNALGTISLDPDHPIPLYYQLSMQIEGLVNTKQLMPEDRLPGQSAIAKQLAVSLSTVRRAMECLYQDKIVYIKRGKGTFISAKEPAEQPFTANTD